MDVRTPIAESGGPGRNQESEAGHRDGDRPESNQPGALIDLIAVG
jgi:hypothetical protein